MRLIWIWTRACLMATICIFSACADPGDEGERTLHAIESRNGWGIIDSSGKVIVPPNCVFIDELSFDGDHSEQTFLVERTANTWMLFTREKEVPLCSGTDVLSVSGGRDGLIYIIRQKAGGKKNQLIDLKELLDPDKLKAAELRPFHNIFEGMLRVERGGKIGFVDRSGNLVIPPQFDDAGGFSEGLAVVKVGRKHGYIDKTGRMVIEPQFPDAFSFDSGRALVADGGVWWYIDRNGERAFPGEFDKAYPFREGLAAVRPMGSDLYRYIDIHGKQAIDDEFIVPGLFSEGLACVTLRTGQRAYIHKDGSVAIDLTKYGEILSASEFHNGVAELHLSISGGPNQKCCITYKGKQIWPRGG